MDQKNRISHKSYSREKYDKLINQKCSKSDRSFKIESQSVKNRKKVNRIMKKHYTPLLYRSSPVLSQDF